MQCCRGGAGGKLELSMEELGTRVFYKTKVKFQQRYQSTYSVTRSSFLFRGIPVGPVIVYREWCLDVS